MLYVVLLLIFIVVIKRCCCFVLCGILVGVLLFISDRCSGQELWGNGL